MSSQFSFDVFLSHSFKDKAVVRTVAERLRADGLRVWFDAWEIQPGDSIPAKIEEGLDGSRVLVLCMSANAFSADWVQLEAGTFRFRDPLNKERRFIPLRLDDAPIKGALAQFLNIDWRPANREKEYPKLLDACRPPKNRPGTELPAASERLDEGVLSLGHTESTQQPVASDLKVFEGVWTNPVEGSWYYARLISGELLVPYCYSGNDRLIGHFYDLKAAGNMLRGRFEWLMPPRTEGLIGGVLVFSVTSPDRLDGGWWWAKDVPRGIDPQRIGLTSPRMNTLVLERVTNAPCAPWAEEYFKKAFEGRLPSQGTIPEDRF